MSNDIKWAVPKNLKIPPDPLKLRIDFHESAVVMYQFYRKTTASKIVSAQDIINTVASEVKVASGFLPENALWWQNTRDGPVFAIYEEPAVRKLAIQFDINKAPVRYNIPVPGCLFLCSPGRAPAVWAVKHRPSRPSDLYYHAPFPNMYANGTSCGGTNQYPIEVNKIPQSFWISFFTAHGALEGRSIKHSKNIIRLWEELVEKKETKYPMEDLVKVGKIESLMR